jgi:hypothetical protein
MRKIALIAVGILIVPGLAFAAISLTASAGISGGTALGTATLLECTGYSYSPSGNPWTQCTPKAGTTMDFGTLDTRLRTSGGADNGGAGCFYATKFYIVYLFPDAWGGKGYQITQQGGATPAAIADAPVFTPVYSSDDKYSGAASGQGAMNADEISDNPDINVTQLAKNYSLVFKSKRPRIIRAEYGIPPNPGTGQTRPAGWTAVPLTTPVNTYSVSITISLTEY